MKDKEIVAQVNDAQLARIHRILDDEEARLKDLSRTLVVARQLQIQGSLATIRKIKGMI